MEEIEEKYLPSFPDKLSVDTIQYKTEKVEEGIDAVFVEVGANICKEEPIDSDPFGTSGQVTGDPLDIKPWSYNGPTKDNSGMSDTETADQFIDVTFSPPRKRIKKSPLDVQAKEIILNIYKLEFNENPLLPIAELERRVADKVGVGRSSVYEIIKEYKKKHTFNSPKKHRERKSIIDYVDDYGKNAIRQKVHQFFFRNELPTIDKVLLDVNNDPDLPNFKRTTFYKFLKTINFKFEKRGRRSMLLDKTEIVVWRRDYLTKIRKLREENRKVYYLGETSLNAGHTKSKDRIDKSVTSSLSPGLGNASGKGKALIICHIGNEHGFVPGALWAFESKKKGDCHDEINVESFENWFSQILPKLDQNAVIVLDDAPYHSRKLEIPTASSSKSEIQAWLRAKNIHYNDSLLKAQLLVIVGQHKLEYNKYTVDEMARNQNKMVLRLPPYHCELNPIEPIWAAIKKCVAAKNNTFESSDMKELFREAVGTITTEVWKNCVSHVIDKVEKKMWELDNILEAHAEMAPTTIDFDDSSSSTSD